MPDEIKARYATAFEIEPDLADPKPPPAARSGSTRPSPSTSTWPHPPARSWDEIYKLAWTQGLKTTYYLRTLGATAMEKTSSPVDRAAAPARRAQFCSIDNPDWRGLPMSQLRFDDWDDAPAGPSSPPRLQRPPGKHLQPPARPGRNGGAPGRHYPGSRAPPACRRHLPGPHQPGRQRVVNGKADINQLAPFKYPWAWEFFLNANRNHWTPLEISMAQDVHDYNHKLTPAERHVFETCCPTSPPPTSWPCATSAWR